MRAKNEGSNECPDLALALSLELKASGEG